VVRVVIYSHLCWFVYILSLLYIILPSFHCFHSEYFQSALKRPEVATVPTPSPKNKRIREEEEEEEYVEEEEGEFRLVVYADMEIYHWDGQTLCPRTDCFKLVACLQHGLLREVPLFCSNFSCISSSSNY
jgi:hypothetical protein